MFKKGSPSSEDPLFSLENVILTPHMASNTAECMARLPCYGICPFQIAFGEGQILSWLN